MANVIAIVWDFDKTLISGYMQDPMFKKFGVDAGVFWREVNELPQKYWNEQKVKVNKDTIYLNHILKYVQEGKFKNLNNKMLEEFGKQLVFYSGIPDIFQKLKEVVTKRPEYAEFDIKVEHYVVSTGLVKTILGSPIKKYISHAWGCELIEKPNSEGINVVSEIGYTIDNTSKTRALFEINKGILQNENIEVNSKVPEALRRVHFNNIIYIADGPSDIPAFSLVNKNGGSTFAIYPKNDNDAFRQVERLRADGRIDMYAVADYSPGTTAYLWLTNKVQDLAEKIRNAEKKKFAESVTPAPTHLISGAAK